MQDLLTYLLTYLRTSLLTYCGGLKLAADWSD